MLRERELSKGFGTALPEAIPIERDHFLADKIAQKIVADLETRDVYEIARLSDISIVFERWFPVTFGEFDRKNRRMTVNQNAPVAVETIIAHELGHYFLQNLVPSVGVDFERLCDRFADALLK
ncbi:hypothetical protein BH10ACI2_BH10ACI2_17580 [soil metagenome]